MSHGGLWPVYDAAMPEGGQQEQTKQQKKERKTYPFATEGKAYRPLMQQGTAGVRDVRLAP